MDELAFLCRYVSMGWRDWLILGLCGVWLLAVLSITLPEFDGHMGAAWVQAIGSIVAICVAIWVAERSRREALIDRWISSVNMAAVGGSYLRNIMERASQNSQNQTWNEGHLYLATRELDGALSMLTGTHAASLPNPSTAGMLVNLIRLAHAGAAHLLIVKNQLARGQEIPRELFDDLTSTVIETAERLDEEAQTHIRAARNRLG